MFLLRKIVGLPIFSILNVKQLNKIGFFHFFLNGIVAFQITISKLTYELIGFLYYIIEEPFAISI